ncbi:MAG: GNAT family N-acetyltransferase [Planctomycetota bacterium]
MHVRPAMDKDRQWITDLLRERWGGPGIVVTGRMLNAAALPALIAEDSGQRCGLATYELHNTECEIVSLDAVERFHGIGTALVTAMADLARARHARRLVVTTTNDNLDALRFYQRRGFVIATIRPDAIEESRRLKQAIPATGCHGIPIRDEIELVRQV